MGSGPGSSTFRKQRQATARLRAQQDSGRRGVPSLNPAPEAGRAILQSSKLHPTSRDALVLCNATMYYGEVIYGFLPIVQKVSLVSWVFWLFGLSLMDSQAMKRAGQLNGEARVT